MTLSNLVGMALGEDFLKSTLPERDGSCDRAF
jgi:hypothetical protein